MVFKAKGDRAEWRIVYEAVCKMPADGVLTYERITELLGRDLGTNRGPIQRAMQELEEHDHRTLVCERGRGYRIANPTEHEQLARMHATRSHRQLGKAVSRARSADRSELTPEQARRLDHLEVQLSEHAEMMTRLDERDREREAQIQQLRRDTSGDIAHLSDQVTNLTEALRRHGISVDETDNGSSAIHAAAS